MKGWKASVERESREPEQKGGRGERKARRKRREVEGSSKGSF